MKPKTSVVGICVHFLVAAICLRALYTVVKTKQNKPKPAGVNKFHSNTHKIGMR